MGEEERRCAAARGPSHPDVGAAARTAVGAAPAHGRGQADRQDRARTRRGGKREGVGMTDVRMKVWRGDATGGAFVDFTVPADEGMVVLDVVHRIQATHAPDLAVRWNCKAGKCGSCSAEINGHPKLMCMTRMSIFEAGETITVAPMKTFPLI